MKMWNEKEKERAALILIEQPTSPSFWSSVRSTQAENQRYTVDDITEATPCMLHVPVGKGDFTVEAATGQAIPCRVFHSQDIPAGYAKVQVDSVQPLFMKYKLDISTPEGKSIITGGFLCEPLVIIGFHRRSLLHLWKSSISTGIRSQAGLLNTCADKL